MAVTATFKQACPSCEALISIKESMVGKKIECTKCKDKFIAERPDEIDDEVEVEVEEDVKPTKKKSTAVTAKAGSPGKANGKAAAGAKSKKADPDDEDDDGAKKAKPAKKAGKFSTLTIGLSLAVVGVVILGVAAMLLLSGGGGGGGGKVIRPAKDGIASKDNVDDEEKDKDKKDDKKKVEPKPPEVPAVALNDVELAKLTNLLPPDAEHVFHAYFKDLFHASNPLRDHLFETPGGLNEAFVLNDAHLVKGLGFSLASLDDLICAERHSGQQWKYSVLHFSERLKEADLKTALKLKPVSPIHGQTWYQIPDQHPWFDTLSQFRFGIPNQLRAYEARTGDRSTYVRIHNAQTLIVGDETPIKALLNARGQFAQKGAKPPNPSPPVNPKPKDPPTDPPANPNPDPGGKITPPPPGSDGKEQPPPNPNQEQPPPNPGSGGGGRDDFYLTISADLKAVLDRMETRESDKEKILISSATDMKANRVTGSSPEFTNTVVRRPRQVWDVTLAMEERVPRVRLLGTSLIQHEPLRYQLRNELNCAQEKDAIDTNRELTEKAAPMVARFVQRLTMHKVKVVDAPETKKDPVPLPNPEQKPEEKKPTEITESQITTIQEGSRATFLLDIVPDNFSKMALERITKLAAGSMRGQAEAAMSPSLRHALANAGARIPEKGMSEQDIAAGRYPPGAFRRTDAEASRVEREPGNRVSWMAALLPHLGHNTIFSSVKFDRSWRAADNWTAGSTMVPQFLDPMYPDKSRLIGVNGSPLDFAATHYVGIAGVGLDAAAYKRGDPATKHKQGVLGYDESAKLEDVIAGRGQSNAILMIQIPHDGPTGVSPWIAGGGATLRGVPEKNSIAPFVLSKDRNGKSIEYQKKRGTYALMTDGSVRFITENVSDETFKAMSTVGGPKPDDFNLDKNVNTPLVPAPDAKTKPVEKQPEVKVPPKVEPEKKKADPEPKADPKKDVSMSNGALDVLGDVVERRIVKASFDQPMIARNMENSIKTMKHALGTQSMEAVS